MKFVNFVNFVDFVGFLNFENFGNFGLFGILELVKISGVFKIAGNSKMLEVVKIWKLNPEKFLMFGMRSHA